jgi:hypothetical protein
MGKDYLAQLPIDDSVRRKIEELDAPTPIGLLSIIRSSPQAFDSLVGHGVARELEEALTRMVPAHEQEQIFSMPKREFALGAMVDSEEPGLSAPGYDVAERDALFAELESLRKSNDRSPAAAQKIHTLEEQLEALLNSKIGQQSIATTVNRHGLDRVQS